MFQPKSGRPARGTIQPDGSFELSTFSPGDGAVVGHNRVRITCYEGQEKANDLDDATRAELSLGRSLIPKRYTSYGSSGLTFDVPATGTDRLELKLTATSEDE